jgi:hypothetical protein
MITLPFFRKKDSLVFLLTLVLFSFLSVSAQTVIREKVNLKPTAKRLLNTQTDYSPLVFSFQGVYFLDVDGVLHDFPYNVSIECSNGNSNQSNCPGGDGQVNLTMPAINGEYTVTVNSLRDYGSSSVAYSVTWIDPSGSMQQIDGFEMWFHNLPGNVHTQCVTTFSFYGIPAEPAPSDFNMSLSDSVVYGSEECLVNYGFSGEDPPTSASVSLNIECTDPDVVFFNRNLWQDAGRTLTVSLDDSEIFSVKSNSANQSYPKHVKVIAVCNGIQREDTVMIEKPNYVKAYFEKESLSPGDTVNIIIKKVDNHYGWESDYPDTTHFEVGMIEDCGAGDLLSAEGITAKFFPSIMQPIRFIVADSMSAGADSVVLRVGAPIITTSEPIIWGAKVEGKNKKYNYVTAAADNVNNSKRKLNITEGNYCTAGSYTYGNADFPVGKVGGGCDDKNNWCETNDPPQEPQIIFDRITDETNFCSGSGYGAFGILEEKLIKGAWTYFSEINTEACYNSARGRWQFKLSPDNKLHVQYTLDVCEDKIKTRWESYLESINDIYSNKIPEDSICRAIQDLNSFRSYDPDGEYDAKNYTVINFFRQHESNHLKKFSIDVNKYFEKYNYKNKYLSYSLPCISEPYNDVINKANGNMYKLTKDFREKLHKRLLENFGKSFISKKGKVVPFYEQDAQNEAFKSDIQPYIDALDGRRKKLNITC